MEEFRISLHFHIVFSTKNQEPIIAEHVRQGIWDVMGDAAREHRIKALCIGGTLDHVHLLFASPKTIPVEEIVQVMKKNSAAWVREAFPATPIFAWQEGYAAFSVSESDIPKLTAFINDQSNHHRHTTFRQEYIALLEENHVAYDPADLWS
jgi:REP element-mobilizing transposase RayT